MNLVELNYVKPLNAIDEIICGSEVSNWKFHIDESLPVFSGHYPHHPIFPGVFAVESILQACSHTLSLIDENYELSQIKSVRFLSPFNPGDQLIGELKVSLIDDGDVLQVRASCLANDERALSARLLFRKAGQNTNTDIPVFEQEEASKNIHFMDHQEVKKLLPHRFPILLVDQVVSVEPGVLLVAEKCISGAESCFEFVGNGVEQESLAYPYTLLIESFCQASGLLASYNIPSSSENLMLFGYMTGIEFFDRVYPGEVVRHYVTLDKALSDSMIFSGRMEVAGRLLATVNQVAVAVRSS